MLNYLILLILGLLPISALADISFVVTNAEDAISEAHNGSLGVGAIIIAVVGGVFVVNLIMKILKGAL